MLNHAARVAFIPLMKRMRCALYWFAGCRRRRFRQEAPTSWCFQAPAVGALPYIRHAHRAPLPQPHALEMTPHTIARRSAVRRPLCVRGSAVRRVPIRQAYAALYAVAPGLVGPYAALYAASGWRRTRRCTQRGWRHAYAADKMRAELSNVGFTWAAHK